MKSAHAAATDDGDRERERRVAHHDPMRGIENIKT
jgi:hypothetical protein